MEVIIPTGEYIMRLDADDWLCHDIVEKLVDKITSRNDLCLVFPDYYEVDADGNTLSRIKRHNFDNSVSILDQPKTWSLVILVRKKLLESVQSFGSNYNRQGCRLWIALSRKYAVTNLNEPLFYRKHGNSLFR